MTACDLWEVEGGGVCGGEERWWPRGGRDEWNKRLTTF